MADHVARLARALRRAVDEHGRPNTFGPGELASLCGGPSAMIAGRIGRDIVLMGRLYEAIGGHAWGSAPRYAGGRFAV